MIKTIKTRIQLRRETEASIDQIKDTFIPLKGEVVLVDTASDGIRAKIGDGSSTFSELSFSDENLRALATGTIVRGYYYNGRFYANEEHTITIVGYDYKIYIDIPSSNVYEYDADGLQFVKIGGAPVASSTVAGITKLYNELGNNTDGTMTQGSITTEIGKKFKVEFGSDETLVFTK